MHNKSVTQILADFDLMFRTNQLMSEYNEKNISITDIDDLNNFLKFFDVFFKFNATPSIISVFNKLLDNSFQNISQQTNDIQLAKILHDHILHFRSEHEHNYQTTYSLLAKYMSPLFLEKRHNNFLELFFNKSINSTFLYELHKLNAEIVCNNELLFNASLSDLETLSDIGYLYNYDFFNYLFTAIGNDTVENNLLSYEKILFHFTKLKEQNQFSLYLSGSHILEYILTHKSEAIFYFISPQFIYESFSDHNSFMNSFRKLRSLNSYFFFPYLNKEEQESLIDDDLTIFLSFIQKNKIFSNHIFQTVTNTHYELLNEKEIVDSLSDDLKRTIDYKTVLLTELSYPSFLHTSKENISPDDFLYFNSFLYFLNHLQNTQKIEKLQDIKFDENSFFLQFSLNEILFLKEHLKDQNLVFKDFLDSMSKHSPNEIRFLLISHHILDKKFEQTCIEKIYSNKFLLNHKDLSYFYSNYETANKVLNDNNHPLFSNTVIKTVNLMDYVIYNKDKLIYQDNVSLVNQICINQDTYAFIKNTTKTINIVSEHITFDTHNLINENFNCSIDDFLYYKKNFSYLALFSNKKESTTFNEIISFTPNYLTCFHLSYFNHQNKNTIFQDETLETISSNLEKKKNYYDYLSFFNENFKYTIKSNHPEAKNGYSSIFNLLIDNYCLPTSFVTAKDFYNLFKLNDEDIYFVIHNVLTHEHDSNQFDKNLFRYLSLKGMDTLSEEQISILSHTYSTTEIIDSLISGHQLKINALATSFFDDAINLFKIYYDIKFTNINNITKLDSDYNKLIQHLSKMSLINKLFFHAFFVFMYFKKEHPNKIACCTNITKLKTFSEVNNDLDKLVMINRFYISPYHNAPFLTEDENNSDPILEPNKALLYSSNNLSLYIAENSMNKNDIFKQYKKLFDKKQSQVLRLVTSKDLLENIDLLYNRFPHFEEVINYIRDMLLLSTKGDNTFYIPPTLLLGGAGVGKTFFVHTICNIIKTHFVPLNTQSISANFVLHGTDQAWSSSSVGIIFKSLFHSKEQTINPVFLLDEIDKTGGSSRYDVANSLLPVLERYTAKNYKDECIPLPIDASNISWFATANDINTISIPLLSRFETFTIPNPNLEQKGILAENVYQSILLNNSWGSFFNNQLPEATKSLLANDLSNGGARDLRKVITFACSQAIKENSNELRPDFFKSNTTQQLPWDF